ncbi:MAG TPA: dual specificity protein phosphatase [Terriglobia bacterium]|nr:dual specificity protein phosphatase [Terriglobia bacterium]
MVDCQFVTERLALGGSIRTEEQMRELAGIGITHVVNLQKEFDNSRLADGCGVRVLWNGCEDDFLPKPAEFFWKGVRFALEALADPRAKVYFHCAAGIHRGPLMVLAVLRALGYERREAINLILDARPQANFPPVYLMSVEDFVREFRAVRQAS